MTDQIKEYTTTIISIKDIKLDGENPNVMTPETIKLLNDERKEKE